MDVAWLRVFREVAVQGSLTGAAAVLGYTQPAVSRQIAALERAVGGRLFDRLPRGVRLTAEGAGLLPHAEAVLARLRAAEQSLESLRELRTGRLRAGAFDSANAALVPRALAGFRADHPGVVLSLAEANSTVLAEQLRNGELDVAVISDSATESTDPDEFELDQLGDDPLLVALPAGHRRAGAEAVPLRLADLAEESWIEGFPAGSRALEEACLRVGFRPRIEFQAREWVAKQGFVAAGLGLALLPRLAAGSVPPGVVLRELHPDDAPVRRIHLATLRLAAAPPSVAEFRRHLVTAAEQLGLRPRGVR